MSSRPEQTLAGAFAGFILGFLGGILLCPGPSDVGYSVQRVWITCLSTAIVGALICGLVGWFGNLRLGRKATCFALVTVVLGGITIVVLTHVRAGTFRRMAYHQQGRELVADLNDIVHRDPRFADVELEYCPAKFGFIDFRGTVSSEDEIDELRHLIKTHWPSERMVGLSTHEIRVVQRAGQ